MFTLRRSLGSVHGFRWTPIADNGEPHNDWPHQSLGLAIVFCPFQHNRPLIVCGPCWAIDHFFFSYRALAFVPLKIAGTPWANMQSLTGPASGTACCTADSFSTRRCTSAWYESYDVFVPSSSIVQCMLMPKQLSCRLLDSPCYGRALYRRCSSDLHPRRSCRGQFQRNGLSHIRIWTQLCMPPHCC